ncbi:hypothetical protein [Sanguibacter antarcticus]|uniref:Uncharacterized protein n=1 Tax=Sanguibacter antarcticus TaxID=372484 RepID=A0A2A9E680_9MICO|nr:hypothetical protein [Sanguibacter antarcticus]PFG34061.1 hypothetical protein ATL42_1961 [Sanguibacter antarcticus]
MSKKPVQSQVWSHHDAAILNTRDIVDRSLNGTLDMRPLSPVTFRTAFGSDEKMLAVGGFQRCSFRPVGDGSYSQSSGMFLATGRGALAATALFAGAQAIGNSSRRAAARADATARWAVDDAGSLFVSTHGFYMQSRTGFFPWPWEPVSSMELVGPRTVHLQGQGIDGTVSWLLRSDWAELLLVQWALHEHPSHPQLGRWIPPGWEERYAEQVLTGSAPPQPSIRTRLARLAGAKR